MIKCSVIIINFNKAYLSQGETFAANDCMGRFFLLSPAPFPTNQKDVATIFCTNVHTMDVIEEHDNADSFHVFSVPCICMGITACVK